MQDYFILKLLNIKISNETLFDKTLLTIINFDEYFLFSQLFYYHHHHNPLRLFNEEKATKNHSAVVLTDISNLC